MEAELKQHKDNDNETDKQTNDVFHVRNKALKINPASSVGNSFDDPFSLYATMSAQ